MAEQPNKSYKVLGLMSGTSLDGLDLALCEFDYKSDTGWTFRISHAETIAYTMEWKQALSGAHLLNGQSLLQLDRRYGSYLGTEAKRFLIEHQCDCDFISSHGHTVFHQPEKGFTFQIGHGSALAAQSGKTVVCDFRSEDVALGGQGAPLVPVGDKLLFGNFQSCLNIGGIANISFDENQTRRAFDICPANLVFNFLAEKKELPYDKDGKIAESGKINQDILKQLNQLEFYSLTGARSLGREWIETEFLPKISHLTIEDAMATALEHVAQKIAEVVNDKGLKSVLLSGGGAYNTYLIKQISTKTEAQLILPEKTIIEFKEALVFAFLGVLRMRNEINIYSSVTGAIRDSCGGSVYVS